MRPVDVQIIGAELGIRWEDGSETFIPLSILRRHCPCASCAGEKDIFGQVYKGPPRTLDGRSVQLESIAAVGGYALQPVWKDGHNTGLYSFDLLRRLGTLSHLN